MNASPSGPVVVVAGATGHLGAHVTRALLRRGCHVRALTRTRARAAALGAQDIVEADLTRGDADGRLTRACQGADVVCSCAGASLDLRASRDRQTFARVDREGNLALVAAAGRAGVGRFVYVAACDGTRTLRDTTYMAAHEAVADALAAGSLSYAVVRPTGLFWFFGEVLRMAASGRGVVLGDGRARTNPVHEVDAAEVSVAAVLEAGTRGNLPVGGPVTYTRSEIAELAFAALGRTPRLVHVPAGLVEGAARVLRPIHARIAALVEFGARVSVTDVVAPPHGTRELGAYFAELARAGTTPPQRPRTVDRA